MIFPPVPVSMDFPRRIGNKNAKKLARGVSAETHDKSDKSVDSRVVFLPTEIVQIQQGPSIFIESISYDNFELTIPISQDMK